MDARCDVDQKQTLIDLGFEEVGNWKMCDGQLRHVLTKYADKYQVLYAFDEGNAVLYIGKTNGTLYKRLNQYHRPGRTQNTNIGNNLRIKALLEDGVCVQIWALVASDQVLYRGWPVNVAAGLEDDLIWRLKPIWNRLGNRKTLGQELKAAV